MTGLLSLCCLLSLVHELPGRLRLALRGLSCKSQRTMALQDDRGARRLDQGSVERLDVDLLT